MRYRRALLFVDPLKDPMLAVRTLRRVAPDLRHLLVLGPPSMMHEALVAATRDAAPSVEVQIAPELNRSTLLALCTSEDVELVVFASRSIRSATLVAAQRLPVAVLWADGEQRGDAITEIGCIVLGHRSWRSLGAFLRDHGHASMHVSLLSATPIPDDVLDAARQISGIRARLTITHPRKSASMLRWIEEWATQRPLDLLVLAQIPTALLLGAWLPTPVLFVPALSPQRAAVQRAIDIGDLVDTGGPLRVHIDQVGTLGSFSPAPDQLFAFVSGGRVTASVASRDGEAELPPSLPTGPIGVFRASTVGDPLAAIEQRIMLVRPTTPLVLIDAALDEAHVAAHADARQIMAVRMRPTQSITWIRRRLRNLGVTAHVVDARTVLDEGSALDVSDALDAVRLERVASKLRRSGYEVERVVHRVAPPDPPPEAQLTQGNHVQLEFDNHRARDWLLEAIAGSRHTLHMQVYMALDDEFGRHVERALSEAGERGVRVRVLVDSLHGLHGSFGARNPLLERLSGHRGIEVRLLNPITELPSLADLKVRDHRKLVVADGTLALIGGRNLSAEYYTAFDEAKLHAASQWRHVPWLDAGARVEGPVVADIARCFSTAWQRSGGEALNVDAPGDAGTHAAQLIVHEGLKDARTLDSYRALFDAARSHIYVVNGFPLVLELQHALLRALERGVRVRAVIGHLTPTHDGQHFEGRWATARTFATDLVHSRMDPLVHAGAEVFLLALANVAGWQQGLGVVHPHVHAKAISVDGELCTVGSANLDVTSSYWENELLLLVRDPRVARAFESQVDALLPTSPQLRADDPKWQSEAKRRAWMRHWPGTLSV